MPPETAGRTGEGAPEEGPDPRKQDQDKSENSASPNSDQSAGATELRLAEARKASARGWALVQLNGKVPFRRGWQKAPVPPLATVEAWAMAGNVGLRTGPVSGVVVVDDDTEDGSGVADLNLPRTVTVETGSGKRHYYFKAPPGKLGNAPGNLPADVDLRGNGGQVVFVGSIHPDTGKPYQWVPGLSPDEVELAELPQQVLDLIQTPRSKPKAAKRATRRPTVAIDQEARGVLDEAAKAVAAASEGSRNKTLNAEAFRMARWVSTGLLARADVEAALSEAARATGLDEQEVASTLRSGLNAGLQKPLRHHQPDSEPRTAPGPSILIEGGALPRIVVQAESALLQSRVPIYQRGNCLVRAMRAPTATMRDVYRRAEGVLMLAAIDGPYMVEVLTRVARWYRMIRRELRLIDCPERVARTYLARSGHWRLPYLLGVIETPTLRPDGSILETPGYDAATCLLFDPGSTKFPTIPENPTREEALVALACLIDVIKAFPWLDPSDRSSALAAILTALIRASLRTAPLFAFRAPKMASGKSLLADVVALISTGRAASVMSQGKDEDEDKKRLLAVLVEGIPVACIDNIEREFGGAALCTVLTQETWRERILGKTGTATVPTNTTWLATGNNLRFVGDIVTRVVPCDLDPKVEKPEERVFDVDLHKYVPAHRPELVVAGLTVLRAYHVAGRPSQGLPVFGRFEEWSDWVRSALVWLGEPDPCLGRARLSQYDPVGSQLRALLSAWFAALKGGCYSAAEVIQKVAPQGDTGRVEPLYQAFLDVAMGQGGKPDSRRLGNYLSKHERRLEAGLRIERVGERQGVSLWRVVAGDSPPEPVGLVGFGGPLDQMADAVAPDCNFAGDAEREDTAEARDHDTTKSRPGQTDPRNPHNPRAPAAPVAVDPFEEAFGPIDDGSSWDDPGGHP